MTKSEMDLEMSDPASCASSLLDSSVQHLLSLIAGSPALSMTQPWEAWVLALSPGGSLGFRAKAQG